MEILAAIGNTSMVQLRKIVPSNGARILAKLEWENPTGSMKDRMAQAVIARAEADGRLKPGDTVIAGTSSGANVVAALQVAERLGPRAKVVTLMVDSGLKYLSTDVHGRPSAGA